MATLTFGILPVMKAALTDATRAFRRAEAAAAERRKELAEAIREANREGMKQVDIVKVTGYTREHIRRIVAHPHEHD